MTSLLVWTIYFYYIAHINRLIRVFVNCYISEMYLFVVAVNVGFLKLFAGL